MVSPNEMRENKRAKFPLQCKHYGLHKSKHITTLNVAHSCFTGLSDAGQKFQLSDPEDNFSFLGNSSQQGTVVNPCLDSTYRFVEVIIEHLVKLHKVTNMSCFYIYLRRRRRVCFWCGLFVCLFVCLSICLSVRRITCKLVNGFWRNFLEG